MTRKGVAGSDRFDIDYPVQCNGSQLKQASFNPTAQLNPTQLQDSQLKL